MENTLHGIETPRHLGSHGGQMELGGGNVSPVHSVVCCCSLCERQHCWPIYIPREADGLSIATPVRFTDTVTPPHCSDTNRLSHRVFCVVFPSTTLLQ